MKYKTLIFDFDGTIADTHETILNTMRFMAEILNIDIIDEEQIKKRIGLPLEITFREVFLLDEKKINNAIIDYRNYYNNVAIDSVSFFSDVKNTLSEIYNNGITMAIASSRGKDSLINILKRQQVYNLFTFIGGEEDVKNKKPAPDIVNRILDACNCSPNDCLVVGDTVFDIKMGQQAKTDTCGVTYGYNARVQLVNENPNYIIDEFKTLLQII